MAFPSRTALYGPMLLAVVANNIHAFEVPAASYCSPLFRSLPVCSNRGPHFSSRYFASDEPSGSWRSDLQSSSENIAEPSGDTESTITPMTLMERMDAAGQKLKPMAIDAKDQSVAAGEDKTRNALYTAKACALFGLFMLYRAYRGLFVLLPEVFRQTSAKLEKAVSAPFVDLDELDREMRDVNPDTGNIRWRTRFTVSILAVIVVAQYVISGAWIVLMKFMNTVKDTSSVKGSFEAAADEFLENEEKIKKMTEGKGVNGSADGPLEP